MAKTVTTWLEDDLDGSATDVSTVRFMLDGKEYEIDLGPANRTRLEAIMGPFTDAARRTARRTSGGTTPRRSTGKRREDAEIRAWARRSGMSIADRGRISGEVRRRYAASQRG